MPHVGIIDSEKRELLDALDMAEGMRYAAKAYLDEQYSHNLFVVKGFINTVDHINRLGKPMDWRTFERKLRRLPHGDKLVFREQTVRPFRGVCLMLPDGKEISISGYGRTVLPEYSTLEVERKIVPDFSITHLSHKDFPEMVWNGDDVVGLHNIDQQKGWTTKDGSLRPGWKYEYELRGENPDDPASRGWRTVLCRWVAIGLRDKVPFPTPEEIEREFSSSDSPQWAKYMGKQSIITPF